MFVSQIGKEVFRLCDELVDEVLLVDEVEITAAVQDAFLDTRAVFEPHGALSLAGLKQYATSARALANGERPAYVAIGSDASNIEFNSIKRS